MTPRPGTTRPTLPSTAPALPGNKTKAAPSTADMTAKLRRVLIAAKYRPIHPSEPTQGESHAIRLAWEGSVA